MSDDSSIDPEGLALGYAKEWSQLSPAYLRVALKSLEPVLARRQDMLMTQMRQKYRLDVMGLVAGFIVSMASIGGAIYFGTQREYWMAALMTGPACFAVTRLFVLRRADAMDLRNLGMSLRGIDPHGGHSAF